jgi:two-component sensor histidine kinase/CheY-like chemotaxis protein
MAGDETVPILIVDDSPEDRSLVEREIRAVLGDAAILQIGAPDDFEQALATSKPGLVITDLDIKWGSGREVLERVHACNGDCPVIMFTESGNEMVAVDLMKEGLTDYIVKSAQQLPRLRAAVKLALDHAKTRGNASAHERELEASLEHEKTLVRELHHRVRNNLQIITSLLELRARTTGTAAKAELVDLAGRMRALSAVQARIHETERYDKVDFRSVLNDLAHSLIEAYGDAKIQLVEVLEAPLALEVGRAMPLGLLCYEIMLNSFKHAWPGGEGTLRVELLIKKDATTIVVEDNGKGYVPGSSVGGLGSRVARSLAAEAKAELTVRYGPGGGTRTELRLQ